MKNVAKHVWKPIVTLVVLLLLLFGADSVLNAGPSTWTNGGGSAAGFPDGGVIGGGANLEFTFWTGPNTISGTPRGYFNPNTLNFNIGNPLSVQAFEVARNEVADNALATMFAGSYGPSFTPRIGVIRSRGTTVAPTAVQNGDSLGLMIFYGQYGTSVGNLSPSVYLTAAAANNYDVSLQGATFDIVTKAVNTNQLASALTIDSSRNTITHFNLRTEKIFSVARQPVPLSALGPTTVAPVSSYWETSCTIADCGFVIDETDDLGAVVPDGALLTATCSATTTGTCTFPNVAGQQLNQGGGPVVLHANGVVQYLYANAAAAWVQVAPVNSVLASPQTGAGPTTITVVNGTVQGSCSIADCGYRFSETAVTDAARFHFLVSSATTGTCTIDNVAGQQLTVGAVSLVLDANDSVDFCYSTTASAWLQCSQVVIL